MLFTLLGIAAAGFVGYNAVKDEESREKTGEIIKKVGSVLADVAEKLPEATDRMVEQSARNTERAYKRGEISDEEYGDRICKDADYWAKRAEMEKKRNK